MHRHLHSLVLVLLFQGIQNSFVQRHVSLSQLLVVRTGVFVTRPLSVDLLFSQNVLRIREKTQSDGQRVLARNAVVLSVQEHHLHHRNRVHLPVALDATTQWKQRSLRLPKPHVLPGSSDDLRSDGDLLEEFKGTQILNVGCADETDSVSEALQPEESHSQVVPPVIAVHVVRRIVHVPIIVDIAEPDAERDFALCSSSPRIMTTVRQMLQAGLKIAADAREHNTNEVTTGQGPSYGLE